MSYLVDTDVLVDVSRNNQALIDFLDQLDASWAMSIITALELTESILNFIGTSIAESADRSETSESESLMIVKLKKKNTRYRELTLGQSYVVIGIEADDLRILNDPGRPFLYPPDLFSLIDPKEPADWITGFGDDGERYSYPSPLNKSGFFEDFFDDKAKAVGTFWRVVNQRLAASQRRVA